MKICEFYIHFSDCIKIPGILIHFFNYYVMLVMRFLSILSSWILLVL